MTTENKTPVEFRFSNIPAVIRGEFPNGDDLECIYIEEGKIEYYVNNNMSEGILVDVSPQLQRQVEEHFKQVFALPLEQRQQHMKDNPSFVYTPQPEQSPAASKPAPSSSGPKFGM